MNKLFSSIILYCSLWEVMGLNLFLITTITIVVTNCTYYCYVRCATLLVLERGNSLAQNRHNSLSCIVRGYAFKLKEVWLFGWLSAIVGILVSCNTSPYTSIDFGLKVGVTILVYASRTPPPRVSKPFARH